MTTTQKIIKYLAIAFAIFLIVSIIGGVFGAVGIFGGFFSKKQTVSEMQTYSVTEDIKYLDIDISAARIDIKIGDSFSVESNIKNLQVVQKSNRLVIKQEKSAKIIGADKLNDAEITLFIPAKTVFNEVDISTAAGKLTVDSITSSILDLELGAGSATINTLSILGSADIDGGAGQINILSGAINNLDLDMGVGQLNLTSALRGNCSFDCGVGEVNVTLIGTSDDYRLSLEKGIGKIYVDDSTISKTDIIGAGPNHVKIDGGVGTINLKIKDATAFECAPNA